MFVYMFLCKCELTDRNKITNQNKQQQKQEKKVRKMKTRNNNAKEKERSKKETEGEEQYWKRRGYRPMKVPAILAIIIPRHINRDYEAFSSRPALAAAALEGGRLGGP